MCSFCLLSSMKLIRVPNCSLLYLHTNDVNSLNFFLDNKVIAIIKYNCYKKLINLLCYQ